MQFIVRCYLHPWWYFFCFVLTMRIQIFLYHHQKGKKTLDLGKTKDKEKTKTKVGNKSTPRKHIKIMGLIEDNQRSYTADMVDGCITPLAVKYCENCKLAHQKWKRSDVQLRTWIIHYICIKHRLIKIQYQKDQSCREYATNLWEEHPSRNGDGEHSCTESIKYKW